MSGRFLSAITRNRSRLRKAACFYLSAVLVLGLAPLPALVPDAALTQGLAAGARSWRDKGLAPDKVCRYAVAACKGKGGKKPGKRSIFERLCLRLCVLEQGLCGARIC